MPPLRIRQGARALLLTPDDHVLLCRFEFDDLTVWALPGGGLEEGEDHVAALHRELGEELGLSAPVIGAQVWFREHLIPFTSGLWDGQREQVYLVECTDRFVPAPELTWEELAAEHLHELRWWHLDEVDAVDDPRVVFAPRQLGSLLRRIAADGPPAEPFDSGV